MLPNRVRLSEKATKKLQYMKNKTGLTLNVLARIAIMLSIRDGSGLNNAGVSDHKGQELDKAILFGEYIYIYDVMINQYIYEHGIEENPLPQTIAALVEIGVYKMGHVKQIKDINF